MMRNLLILLAVAAAQAGLYFWMLRPQEIYWSGLTGIALAVVTILCWSAVLQIAWRDPETEPDSPDAEPNSPREIRSLRTHYAGLFALLALPAMAGLAAWGFFEGPMVYRVCNSHQALDLDRLSRLDARLPGQVPPMMERRFEVSQQEYRNRLEAKLRRQMEKRDRELFTPTSPMNQSGVVRQPSEADTLLLIDEIRSGDKQEVLSLINVGIELNAPDPDSGLTPLDEASRCGDPTMIETLKRNGAKLSPDA